MIRERLMKDKRIVFGVILTIVIISSILFATKTKATASDSDNRHKYFKSIVLKEGDSLWDIAKEYSSSEYESLQEYIEELKSMNGLTSDTIHAGQNLVVTYYEDAEK